VKRALLLAVGLSLFGACNAKQVITAAPPPLRPEAEPTAAKPTAAKDCDPIDDSKAPAAFRFEQRSINEAGHMADDGVSLLADGTNTANPAKTREDAMTRAVTQLIGALAADPYNVKATYALASVYARIQRPQCSINLLTRLIQMRSHRSKQGEVEAALDHLLGRKQALDPAFAELHTDARFRKLIQTMCAESSDPSCTGGH